MVALDRQVADVVFQPQAKACRHARGHVAAKVAAAEEHELWLVLLYQASQRLGGWLRDVVVVDLALCGVDLAYAAGAQLFRRGSGIDAHGDRRGRATECARKLRRLAGDLQGDAGELAVVDFCQCPNVVRHDYNTFCSTRNATTRSAAPSLPM